MSHRAKAAEAFRAIQDKICRALEASDGSGRFQEDVWERPDVSGTHGGGGFSRVLAEGSVFEQAGVNFSEVHGTLPQEMTKRLTGQDEPAPFFATGVSLVIHPRSPLVPTTHANFRYLEVGTHQWVGGGMDLTPYYLFDEDAVHFHQQAKNVCDQFDTSYYTRFKKWCDEYFYLPHRGETRGIGGLFFDYLGKEHPEKLDDYFAFASALGQAFPECYIPIVERRKTASWTEKQREFQLLRRGRYVEFNLLYDRGTLFGLQTGGRTESILMSLPPLVRWQYNFVPREGTEEARLLAILKAPRDWLRD